MKKNQARAALEALRTVRMPKIADKEVRNDLIADHFILFDVVEKFDKQAHKLEAVHLGAFEEDRKKVGEIQGKIHAEKDAAKRNELIASLNGEEFKELNAAWETYAKEMNAYGNEPVEGLKPIDKDKFLAAVSDAELEFPQLEALYPMLTSND